MARSRVPLGDGFVGRIWGKEWGGVLGVDHISCERLLEGCDVGDLLGRSGWVV